MDIVQTLRLFIAFTCVCSVWTAPLDTTSLCQDMLELNCVTSYLAQGDETVCGTNGITYQNKCFLVQARCGNTALDKSHDGPCVQENSSDVPTDTAPLTETVTETSSRHISSENLCANPENITCPDELDPLCGTNNKFYLNACNFYKEKCTNQDLQIQALSNCKQGGHN